MPNLMKYSFLQIYLEHFKQTKNLEGDITADGNVNVIEILDSLAWMRGKQICQFYLRKYVNT